MFVCYMLLQLTIFAFWILHIAILNLFFFVFLLMLCVLIDVEYLSLILLLAKPIVKSYVCHFLLSFSVWGLNLPVFFHVLILLKL